MPKFRYEEFLDPAIDNGPKCPVTGKRMYPTEGDALATARHQITSHAAPKELRPYLCIYCEAWHLTKSTGRKR